MSTDSRRDSANCISSAAPTRQWYPLNLIVRLYRRVARVFPAFSLSVFGFLVFYLLSAGPIAGIHNVMKVGAFQKAVEVIYAPVVLLVKSNIEPFSSIMKWYVDLFR